ncbi:G-protein coupled receptor Mth2, partial [Pseudolycoriella hygida]
MTSGQVLLTLFTSLVTIIAGSTFSHIDSAIGKAKCRTTIDGVATEKNVGDTWNGVDPCVKYVCETGSNKTVQQRLIREYCFLNCNNEFELVVKDGQCCGECVQTKCRDEGLIYEIGEMWKSSDGCTFSECIQKGESASISSYKKTCPILTNCPKGQVFIKDCCEYCISGKEANDEAASHEFVFDYEKFSKILDKDTYLNHPCVRDCKEGASPMTCNYTFMVEWYETLSKACYNCPFNETDCDRPHCIYGDGVRRSIMTINRMMPGPPIQVCLGDTVVVDVVNRLMGESTSIHWHGMHQRDSPYMDGISLNGMKKITNFIRSTAGRKSIPAYYRNRAPKKAKLLEEVYECGEFYFDVEKVSQKEKRPVVFANAETLLDSKGAWRSCHQTHVYGLINTQTCDKYKLSNDNPDDAYFISHVDGSLRVRAFDESFSNNNYCIEFVNTGTIDIHAFVCFSHYSQEKFKYYAPGLAVSCVFLAVTLICYACLPKLLNLHGKTLVCYVISLLSACISLSYVQFHTETKIEHCYFIVRTSRGMLRNKELRRFLFYSLYAWGVSAMLTTLTYLVDYYHLVPDEWSPRIGSKNVCWFQREDWRGHFIFFLFPVGLHVLTNIILFTLTAIHCNRIKSEISRMQCKDNESEDKKKRFLADKAKYMMNVKLFVVMGVTWMLEVLATLIMSPEELWYVSDYFNILQGVFVFIIFVCKAKVWEAIKQRLGRGTKKTKGPTTVTTQLSVTSNGKLGKSASTSTLSTSNTNLNSCLEFYILNIPLAILPASHSDNLCSEKNDKEEILCLGNNCFLSITKFCYLR